MSSVKNPLLLASIALVLAGCTVGPDYHGAPTVTATDKTFTGAGKIALWTKAESVTRFEQISITVLP